MRSSIRRQSFGLSRKEGNLEYQLRDWSCFSYDLWWIPGGAFFRGPDPRPLTAGNYISFLGAAQTFGRFCNRPFSHQVEDLLGVPSVNLATSSLGPRFYLNRPQLIDIINNGAASVLQVMSGRSASNSKYHNHKYGSNSFHPIGGSTAGPAITEEQMLGPFFQEGRSEVAIQLMTEMRATWLAEMKELIGLIRVPTVLLWLSPRTPAYIPDVRTIFGFTGQFPHLIDADCIAQLTPLVRNYVEIVSSVGLPSTFRNRFTGEPGVCALGPKLATSQSYYPSPEMHELTAARLVSALAPLVGNASIGASVSYSGRGLQSLAKTQALGVPNGWVSLVSTLRRLAGTAGTSPRLVTIGRPPTDDRSRLVQLAFPNNDMLPDTSRIAAMPDEPVGCLLIGAANPGDSDEALYRQISSRVARETIVLFRHVLGSLGEAWQRLLSDSKSTVVPIAFVDDAMIALRADSGSRSEILGFLCNTADAAFRPIGDVVIAGRKVPAFATRLGTEFALDYSRFGIKV